jgi:hypothetical protein
MGLYKTKLIFDPADLADSDQVGAFITDGTDTMGVNADGSINATVTATNLDIRDLTHVSDSVKVGDGTDFLAISAAGAALVEASDLDIRDLSHTQDSVKIGDGTDFLAINADGSINVSTLGTYLEDAAHASGDRGSFMLAVRNDGFATTLTSANGDYSGIAVDAFGRVFVVADLDVTNSAEKAEDAAHSSGDIGMYALGVAQATLAASVSADGDYGSLKLNSRGALWTAPVGTVDDDAADSENPVKVGGKAYDLGSAMAAISAGDRANQATDLYRRQMVLDVSGIAIAHSVVAVGTTAILLPATSLAGRRKIFLQNNSSNPIWIGTSGVTASGATVGLKIEKGGYFETELTAGVSLYGIAGSAGNNMLVWETA